MMPGPSATRGLSREEVARRVARGQVNDVPPSPSRTVGQIIRANVFTRFNALLGVLLVIILIVGPLQDALFGGVLIANTLIGIFQELKAKRTLDRLEVLTAPRAMVLRDGERRGIDVREVVVDDVLELQAGDQVVVDGVVVEAGGLEIDESLLSGEADPVDAPPGHGVLSGSFVAAGSGRYRATRVGRAAYATQLAEDARTFALVRSELRSGIDTILRLVTYAIIPTAALLVVSQLRGDHSFSGALRGTVAGVVAMVPEGLVLLTSVAFAVGVVRLGRKRVLVRELPAVEGLARVDVLCIDKTGTLTEGHPSVEEVEVLDGRRGYEDALAALAAADPHPNATLAAIGERFPAPPTGWVADEVVSFSSARKWSGASFAGTGTWLLGAPEVLLDGGAPGSAEIRTSVTRHADEGRRVLLLARTDAVLDGDALPEGRSAQALVAMGDRPRRDAAATLRYILGQGVAVKVLSGDSPHTVSAIARQLGVEGAEHVVDARELADDPEGLDGALESTTIFGRVSPQQKRDLVKALRSRGHTVAMTGDGVNDALALKDADLGIAMGSGSAASRAVAQLVLLDSSFDAIPAVVAEGRRVLGNIERTSNLYVTKTVYAMLLALAVGAFSVVFPFLPRHLTLIGSLTIGIPSFFLALAPNEERARPGFLRRVLRFAVPAGLLSAVATFLAYSLASGEPGVTLRESQTAAAMVLTWVGLLVLSIVASPLNPTRLAMIWGLGAAFVAALLIPAARGFFALRIPPLIVWLASIGIASLVWSFARLFVPRPREATAGRRPPSGADPSSRAARS